MCKVQSWLHCACVYLHVFMFVCICVNVHTRCVCVGLVCRRTTPQTPLQCSRDLMCLRAACNCLLLILSVVHTCCVTLSVVHRVLVTGLGKSGVVARRMAVSLASIGIGVGYVCGFVQRTFFSGPPLLNG